MDAIRLQTTDLVTRLPLRINLSWTLLGNVTYAGCQWLILVVLTKIGSTAMVGQFALGLAVTAPVFMLSNLQLGTVLATDAKQEHPFGVYLALRLATTAVALAGVLGVVILSGYEAQTSWTILLIATAKAVEAISDIFYGFFQQAERLDRPAISMMIKGPLSVILMTLALYFSRSLFWACIGMAVAWVMVFLVYDLPNGLRLAGNGTRSANKAKGRVYGSSMLRILVWDRRRLAALCWMSLPLGFVMMVISLKTNVPRYFLEHHWGEAELGIFAAVAYLMVAGRTIVGAMGNAASPRLSRYYAFSGNRAFARLIFRLMGWSAILGCGGVLAAIVLGREILTLVYRPEFGRHEGLLLWIMIAAGFHYLCGVLGVGITAARLFRVQAVIDTISLGCVLLLSAYLIPQYGLLGAAWVACFAYALEVPVKGAVLGYALKRKRMAEPILE